MPPEMYEVLLNALAEVSLHDDPEEAKQHIAEILQQDPRCDEVKQVVLCPDFKTVTATYLAGGVEKSIRV